MTVTNVAHGGAVVGMQAGVVSGNVTFDGTRMHAEGHSSIPPEAQAAMRRAAARAERAAQHTARHADPTARQTESDATRTGQESGESRPHRTVNLADSGEQIKAQIGVQYGHTYINGVASTETPHIPHRGDVTRPLCALYSKG